jgi:N,N-dimethylformamidase
VARWDFAREPATARIVDVGGRGHHGVLVNGPTRGVTGSTWCGEEVDHRLVPDQYAAIHFHEDDLDDVAWPEDAALPLPSDLPSGIYAVRVVGAGGCEDRIPFVVLPERRPARQRPAVAVLLPTLTYQAYANSKLSDRIDYAVFGLSERDYQPSERERQLAEVPELYGSLYDVHADGSGRCFSTLRRPILTMRPEWHSALQHAPRHLAADLYLTSWLEELGEEFDVLTDHMLDEEGIEALVGYRVVVTGTHPEYVTAREISALEEHVARGGRLMYLGGNGFYWVTSVDPDRPHVIEVRRGNAGTRTWDSPPGEIHHASTGEPGGLWRHRGRAPNALVGIGMASQGWDLKAPGYRRTRASFASDLAWMFEGLADDEREFGDEGLVMDGAAGDEIDRYDVELGSPRHGVVVASSAGHSRFYKIVHEDLPMSRDGLGGDENENVRSDVTYVPWAGGGGVFATGSITWAGAMAVRNFDNPVARLTTNVLRRFLDPADLPPARALGVEARA